MRTVKIEWRNEWEYCLLFYRDDSLITCVYSQTINKQMIDNWLKHDIKP